MKLIIYIKSIFKREPEKPVFISQEDQRILDHLYMLDLMEGLNGEGND